MGVEEPMRKKKIGNAVKRNKIGTRVTNRVTGKISSRARSYVSRKIMSIFK